MALSPYGLVGGILNTNSSTLAFVNEAKGQSKDQILKQFSCFLFKQNTHLVETPKYFHRKLSVFRS